MRGSGAGPEGSTTHVVVIGAARSGTKILRDTLAECTGAGRVPYDIGYIWRIADVDRADDTLDPGRLSTGHRRFIVDFIERYVAGNPACVIEKTVGNTLRVPYVAEVLPGARFIHLIRNGVDVTESTWRQWREPTDYRYLAAKARHFPLRMLPTYGRRYIASLLRRRLSDDGRVASWGPRYPGIDEDLRDTDLLTVCARQWRESVLRARRDLVDLPSIEIRYEDLVADSQGQLERAARFCGLEMSPEGRARANRMIKPGRSGAGPRALTDEQLHLVGHEIGSLMAELGYEWPRPPEEA